MDISIIIPTYNDEKHIERAIRSCLTQTLRLADYEVVVVDDGSTDSTPQILESYKILPVIRVITLSENRGVGYASNAGIRSARGRYVVRVDSDDYINEHLLEIEKMYLDMNRDMHAIACDYYKVDAEEEIIERVNYAREPIACGVMYRKDWMIALGLYADTRLDEEKEFFVRFVQNAGVYRIALPLYRYFIRDNSLTHGGRDEG